MSMEKIALELDENQVLYLISVLEAEQETLGDQSWLKNLNPELQDEVNDNLGDSLKELISYLCAQVNENRILGDDYDV